MAPHQAFNNGPDYYQPFSLYVSLSVQECRVAGLAMLIPTCPLILLLSLLLHAREWSGAEEVSCQTGAVKRYVAALGRWEMSRGREPDSGDRGMHQTLFFSLYLSSFACPVRLW